MKIRLILLSVLTTFAIGSAMAQHETWDIVPGSKGPLPAKKDLPQAEEGHFAGLTLETVAYRHSSGFIVNGTWMNLDAYEPYMGIVSPTVYGGEYYTLEFRTKSSNAWVTYPGDGEVSTYSSNTATLCPTITEDTDYRLRLHGGPKDGWISNTVSAKMPTVNYSVITRNSYSTPNFIAVGNLVDGTILELERQDRGTMNYQTNRAEYKTLAKFAWNSSCYHRQWYRRNPNNYEMTAIEGATEMDYTPTDEDAGYELFDITTGDDINISFYVANNHGIVQYVIGGSIDYIGDDGVVLNTDYVIPNPDQNLIMSRYDEESGEEIVAPFGDALKQVKPGQYAIRLPFEKFNYGQFQYADEAYSFAFVYKSPIYDEDNYEEPIGYEPWYHFAIIEGGMYSRPLEIQPTLNGQPVATTIDILGKDIDGKLTLKNTLKPEDASEGKFITEVYKGKYYIKAHQTEDAMETYYPDALVWSEAELLEPEKMWEPTPVTITMVATPAPLTGTSTIEGTITVVGKARTRAAGGEIYTVYLKDKATGKIVAQTQTDASGNYKFENVPIGEYIVVPNIDGYKAASPVVVAVTQENQTVSNADCKVTKVSTSEIFNEEGSEEEALAGDADGNGKVETNDVIQIFNYLMGKPADIIEPNADFNKDGEVNIADIIAIVNSLFGD